MKKKNGEDEDESACSSAAVEEVIGGNEEAVEGLRELIYFPLRYSRQAQSLGLNFPTSLLLYGPPGTGKTSLVRAVVGESGANLFPITPHSVHTAYAGQSEKLLSDVFSNAASLSISSRKPSIIFIDEIDALCPRRDGSKSQQDIRVASQLLMLMDSNRSPSSPSQPHVVVVASTNRPEAMDPALRRHGRFHAEIEVTTPTERERFQILKVYTKKVPLDPGVDLQAIATACNGYVGADLEALCGEAALLAARRSSEANNLCLTMKDWTEARSVVGPSITRGVTVEIPNVSWDDIGGLADLKKKLQKAVEWPIKHSAAFERLKISPIRGILLHGPPGCSKTTLAKAAAHAAQATFFSLSGAELYSMYVGEGEALLRNTFRRARLAAPSIIFFDEADVVAAKRGGSSNNNITVGERLLSTLLTEMDGLEQAKGVLVLAATNRPNSIDAALLRPGRFDLVLYVPTPDLEARIEILNVHTRKMEIGDDVDLRQIAEETDLFTGAELEGLCREAGIVALREDISATTTCNRHFQTVKRSLKPALTKAEIELYASFKKNRSPRSSTKSESGGARESVCKSKKLLSPISTVTIGVLGLVVLIAAKYIHRLDVRTN